MAALTHHGYGYPPYGRRAFYVQGCDESRSREALCDAALAASGGTRLLSTLALTVALTLTLALTLALTLTLARHERARAARLERERTHGHG